MVAVLKPQDLLAPASAPEARPTLRLLPAPTRPPASVFWARRAAVAMALVLSLVAVPRLASIGLEAGRSTLGLDAPVLPADAPSTYVVQPGDTVWSVARALQPDGDVRPLVDAIVSLDGDGLLTVGQVLPLSELR